MPLCCCLCCTTQKAAPLDGGEGKSTAYLRQNAVNHSGAERNNSDLSGNDSLVYVGRGIVQRSGKIGFSTGSDHVNSSVSIVNSISSARIAQTPDAKVLN
ncbi:AGAP001022-PB-like protein [Anopheles sinensis]|uniref:AGAP001022-PB-like protein n=1 Tax=Anopheles sinensis TaxID=74873 RepID=A0A084WPY7_ANOSI|nr:AGAP001022-PB-like protein [Anopheles sinensis]